MTEQSVAGAGRDVGVIVTMPTTMLNRRIEYIYFALIAYGILNFTLGIYIPLAGGAGLILLAVYCVWRLRQSINSAYSPLLLPLCCGVSFMLVQIIIYDVSILDGSNVQFINWMLALVIVQSLLLRRGFLHRFAAAMMVVGALLLPHLVGNYGAMGSERAGLEHSIAIANPNDLAAWFGFCCLYCIIVAIETKRNSVRMLSAIFATGCLVVVGLTVSRAPLMAIAIAGIIAARRLLKRGFLPVLLLALFAGIIFVSGMFDTAIGLYAERGTEETGRLAIWPLALGRIIDSPLVGVGLDKIATDIPGTRQAITPHNGFIYLGLASGIIPLAFFVAFWIKAARGAYNFSAQGLQDAAFQLPLFVYTFIIVFQSTGAFMFAWAIVTLCNALPRRASRAVFVRAPASEREAVEPNVVRYALSKTRGQARPLNFLGRH